MCTPVATESNGNEPAATQNVIVLRNISTVLCILRVQLCKNTHANENVWGPLPCSCLLEQQARQRPQPTWQAPPCVSSKAPGLGKMTRLPKASCWPVPVTYTLSVAGAVTYMAVLAPTWAPRRSAQPPRLSEDTTPGDHPPELDVEHRRLREVRHALYVHRLPHLGATIHRRVHGLGLQAQRCPGQGHHNVGSGPEVRKHCSPQAQSFLEGSRVREELTCLTLDRTFNTAHPTYILFNSTRKHSASTGFA